MEIKDVIDCCLRVAGSEDEAAVLSWTDGGARYHSKNARALREAAGLLEGLERSESWEKISREGEG